MTDREKLIERLREIASLTPPICQHDRPIELDVMGKKITAYCKPFEQFQDLMREAADALANGVVVREKGEWERKRVAFHIGCTACGCYVRSLAALVFLDAGELNFCPNCGADMRRRENG